MKLIDADNTVHIAERVFCDDCKKRKDDYNGVRCGACLINDMVELIDNAKAVDAVPVVHGEWILKHVGAGHYWECSSCHKNPCIYVTENTNYCPNCGAKMDGGMNHD